MPTRFAEAMAAFREFDPLAPDAVRTFAVCTAELLGASSSSFWRVAGGQLNLESAWECSAAEAIAAVTGLGTLPEEATAFADAQGTLLFLPLSIPGQRLGAFLFRIEGAPETLSDALDVLMLPASALALALDNERLAFREGVISERLERVTAAVQAPVIFMDAHLRPVVLNPAYRETHGLAEHESFPTLGALWQRVRPCYQDPVRWEVAFRLWHADPTVSMSQEVDLIHPREACYRVVLTPFLDADGKLSGAVVTLYDVTPERRLVRLQADFIDSLEDRVMGRTRELLQSNLELLRANQDLEGANQRLREVDQFKTDLVSILSHELRTPLNLVVGFASLLEEALASYAPAEHQEWVRGVLHGSYRLRGLIDNVLDLSRIDAGRFTLHCTWVDVREQIMQLIEELRVHPEAPGKRLTADVPETLPALWASPETIYQHVLSNLAVNALKFTEPGGEVRLGARIEGEMIVLEVTDTGVGIPLESQDRIFERFYQVDSSSTRRHGGSGLGLAIAKEIVDLHGGHIELESAPGQGSRFRVRLPLAGPPKGEPCTS